MCGGMCEHVCGGMCEHVCVGACVSMCVCGQYFFVCGVGVIP